MRRVLTEDYYREPQRYTIRPGHAPGAPWCPYGNTYKWIGYDICAGEYVRYSKRLFKTLINQTTRPCSSG